MRRPLSSSARLSVKLALMAGEIERFESESSFAEKIGFSAAVRAGDWVHVAGISAVTPEGAIVGGDDAYDQMVEVMVKLEAAPRAGRCAS